MLASQKVTADGIVRNIRAHKERSKTGLKQLRIGGLYGVTGEHLEQLNYLLDGGLQQRSQTVNHGFIRMFDMWILSFHRMMTEQIDVEACPKCGDVTVVYDCTNGSCQNRRECRGCDLCILRCDVCGKCVDGKSERIFVLNKHVPSGVDMQCVDCVACEPPRISRRRIAI